MQQLLSWVKKYWWVIAILVFVASRVYIFVNPPVYVRYFEEYANIWYYGWPPYLKHWYEYPPASIPFVTGPLLLDLSGVGDYRMNFRSMSLFIDVIIFAVMLRVMQKLKYPPLTKLLNALFYIALTVKAKDFMYENLDLLFGLTMFLPAVAPYLVTKGKGFLQWIMYWLGTGLKLVNAPLALLYFLGSKQPFLKRLVVPLITFVMIWAIPLAIFRSSLSVIIIYHQNRQLQVESFPALVVRGLNIVTKSEEIYFSQYKSFDLRGPISNVVLPISSVSLFLFVGLLSLFIWVNRDRAANPLFMMKVTLLFIFGYFLTNKVFSTPYHLWYLPLLIIFPYRHWKERAFFYSLTAIFLGVATSPIPSIEIIKGIFLDTSLPVFTQIPATLLLFWGVTRLNTQDIESPALTNPSLFMKAATQTTATTDRSAQKPRTSKNTNKTKPKRKHRRK